ncbi:MAG: ATP-binding cassette domain-containing protein [Erysipelotrichaceae bacterium]|jgi:ABC-2 type transport system ATP-binding protein|nr:ATP-binding cassette domain-containing protein [Erysipelotrichaceae bacterium]
MAEYIIETTDLTKSFNNKKACDEVNMHVKRGDIYGFIGRNGAGKTTVMKLILGLLTPNKGNISLFGSSTNLNESRKKIGSLVETPALYKNATALENMKRYAILFNGKEEEIKEILDLVGLANTGKKPAGRFSLGMKQRLGIAIALLGNPEILILDEPINGLDPAGIKEVRDTILKLNKEKEVTFLISSHLLDELGKITTTYGIINNGKLVEEIDAEELKRRCEDHLLIKVNDVDKALHILKDNDLLGRYTKESDNVFTLYDNFDKASAINTLLVKNDIEVFELTPNVTGMEEYFIERLGK